MYLITYLDRVNISTVAPVITKEFGFDKVTMGIIFSAFVWAYALFQVHGGWLNDRFGPRRVLAIIVAYWSVMTAATAAVEIGFSPPVYFSRQLMTNCGRSRGRTCCSVACFWQLSTRSFCFARRAASS
jgi:sugar phosphate permease